MSRSSRSWHAIAVSRQRDRCNPESPVREIPMVEVSLAVSGSGNQRGSSIDRSTSNAETSRRERGRGFCRLSLSLSKREAFPPRKKLITSNAPARSVSSGKPSTATHRGDRFETLSVLLRTREPLLGPGNFVPRSVRFPTGSLLPEQARSINYVQLTVIVSEKPFDSSAGREGFEGSHRFDRVSGRDRKPPRFIPSSSFSRREGCSFSRIWRDCSTRQRRIPPKIERQGNALTRGYLRVLECRCPVDANYTFLLERRARFPAGSSGTRTRASAIRAIRRSFEITARNWKERWP